MNSRKTEFHDCLNMLNERFQELHDELQSILMDVHVNPSGAELKSIKVRLKKVGREIEGITAKTILPTLTVYSELKHFVGEEATGE